MRREITSTWYLHEAKPSQPTNPHLCDACSTSGDKCRATNKNPLLPQSDTCLWPQFISFLISEDTAMPRYSYQGQLGHPLQGRVMQPDMRPLGTIRHNDASALSSPVQPSPMASSVSKYAHGLIRSSDPHIVTGNMNHSDIGAQSISSLEV